MISKIRSSFTAVAFLTFLLLSASSSFALTATPTATPAGTATPTFTPISTSTPIATVVPLAGAEPNQVTTSNGNLYKNNGQIADNSNVPLAATDTDLNTFIGAGAATARVPIIVKAALPASGAVAASVWQNTTPGRVLIRRVMVDITTACTTGSSTLNIGTTTASATSLSANLLDTASCTSIATLDNLNDAGSLGKSRQSLAVSGWVTVGPNNGDMTALVGNIYIEYIPI